MTKLTGMLFWLAMVAMAFFPLVADARIVRNHNETLIRDREQWPPRWLR